MSILGSRSNRRRFLGALAAMATMFSLTIGVGQAQAQSTQTFQNVRTGLCLDDSVRFGLRTTGCNGFNYQRWIVTPKTVGSEFRNENTGRCLDYSIDFGLRVNACNGTSFQRWRGARINTTDLVIHTSYKYGSQNIAIADSGGRVYSQGLVGGTQQHWR